MPVVVQLQVSSCRCRQLRFLRFVCRLARCGADKLMTILRRWSWRLKVFLPVFTPFSSSVRGRECPFFNPQALHSCECSRAGRRGRSRREFYSRVTRNQFALRVCMSISPWSCVDICTTRRQPSSETTTTNGKSRSKSKQQTANSTGAVTSAV